MFPQDKLDFWHSGQGFWKSVSSKDWGDWRWQLRHRLSTKEQMVQFVDISEDESVGLEYAKEKLLVSITPYYFNLIDGADFSCPIRKQVIPVGRESVVDHWEMDDPVGEEGSMPVPGLVHRYPDRVLFLVTDRCASYCRYCTRSRMVSNAQGYGFHPNFEIALQYIKKNTGIRDVLLSGGDPLLLSDDKLRYLLGELASISHVEFVRIGSRVPVFLPQRINLGLIEALKKHQNLWISIHVNHPKECTLELREACLKLTDAGIPLGNQSVLLKGVNDHPDIMRRLIHRLLMMRVRPYYLYQCDLVKGSSHLRTSVDTGVEIIRSLRGSTTGYAIPQYVIDAPEGGGKIPINPNYVDSIEHDVLKIRNFEGRMYEYPNRASD